MKNRALQDRGSFVRHTHPYEKSWSENLFYGDIRNINGYEWIQPRQ